VGALTAAVPDVAGDAGELFIRPHLGQRVQTGPDLDLAGDVRDARHDPVIHRFMGIEAGSGAAALAMIEEDRAGGAGNHQADIGIRQDDRRRLAAEFHACLSVRLV
jgi:hypothetical protein